MERTILKQLEMLLKRINVKAGFDNPKYSTIGSYALDGAYGGWKLVQYVNDKGGERNITYRYISKRELYNQMQMFLAGMETK